jgi:hypothetical protein
MINNTFIGAFLLLLLYFASSIDMILNFTNTSNGLKKQTGLNLPYFIFATVIFFVVILKTIGSTFVLYSIFSNKYKNIACYVVYAFIIFNILATLLYHLTPFKTQKINLLKNISIIGGFVLLLTLLN